MFFWFLICCFEANVKASFTAVLVVCFVGGMLYYSMNGWCLPLLLETSWANRGHSSLAPTVCRIFCAG